MTDQPKQEKRIAEVLSDFLMGRKFGDLPRETVSRVKDFVLDVIGCTIRGVPAAADQGIDRGADGGRGGHP